MHRFYLAPEQCRGDLLSLTGSEAYHATRVLRLRAGERIMVLDGAGQQVLAEIAEPTRDQVKLKICERISVPPLPYQITLVQALPKGKLIESIIQKATELGTFKVVPLLSERTVIELAAEDRKEKTAKWKSVAIEAIKQCGSAWLPKINPPLTLEEFLTQREEFELSFVGSLQKDSKHPREYFEAFGRAHGRKAKSICIWIGPEGDFSPRELKQIQDACALPITLGPLVLRAETAAVYCLSIFNYELQDF
jgi:16S rRNA (uracil1498-N3)-methyltransferase